MLQYAVEDVSQLPDLADKLTAEMGENHIELVKNLSAVNARSDCRTTGRHGRLSRRLGVTEESEFDGWRFPPKSWIGQLYAQPT